MECTVLWSWEGGFLLPVGRLCIPHNLVSFISVVSTGRETELAGFVPAFPRQRQCLKPLLPPSPSFFLCGASVQIVPSLGGSFWIPKKFVQPEECSPVVEHGGPWVQAFWPKSKRSIL